MGWIGWLSFLRTILPILRYTVIFVQNFVIYHITLHQILLKQNITCNEFCFLLKNCFQKIELQKARLRLNSQRSIYYEEFHVHFCRLISIFCLILFIRKMTSKLIDAKIKLDLLKVFLYLLAG